MAAIAGNDSHSGGGWSLLSSASSFELVQDYATVLSHPKPCPYLHESTFEACSIPRATSQMCVEIGGGAVDRVFCVEARERIEVQACTRRGGEVANGSLGCMIVEVLQYVHANNEVVGTIRFPLGNVAQLVTVLRACVLAYVGGENAHAWVCSSVPMAPVPRAGADFQH